MANEYCANRAEAPDITPAEAGNSPHFGNNAASGESRQLHITLRGEEITLPMAYRHLQQAMIYHGVRTQNSAHASYLHNEGQRADDRRFKLFTFGPIQGSYTMKDGQITFRGEIRFEIRSADPRLLQTLTAAWKPGCLVQLGKNELTVADCRPGNATITATSLRAKMLSPIVAYITQEDGSTVFYSPEEKEFFSLLHTNAARKWRSFSDGTEVPPFRCAPIPGRPVKKQVTKFKTTRINAWFGEFELSGDARMLDLLYHTGLGAKSSQGFGMFTVYGE